jgi:pimeloyl-ACP methyl ester carboxylesterase
MPPIASHIIAEGHAWIASGYRAREYQPHLFIEDLVALRELFQKEIGPPRWTIIYGQSMGGHIVVASLELRPGLYQGGLVECGLVDGISIADYLMATPPRRADSRGALLNAPDQAFCQAPRACGWALGPGCTTQRTTVRQRRLLMGADRRQRLPLRLRPRRYLPTSCTARDLENSESRARRVPPTPVLIDPGSVSPKTS